MQNADSGYKINYIENLNQFIQVIHSYREVILFPVGAEGNTLLDFLQYTNLTERFCCIATEKVQGNNTQQVFSHSLPIIPLEMLVHFRESALFVVVAPENLYQPIAELLVRFGCTMAAFLHSEVQNQLQAELQKMLNSGGTLKWFMNHVISEINDLKYRVAEQNDVHYTNSKAFSEYRNCFRGKKVVIVATGPTVKHYKPISEALHIGLNRAGLMEDISLNFLCTVDGFANDQHSSKIEQTFNKIQDKIFVGKYINRDDYVWGSFSEHFSLLKNNVRRFYCGDHKGNQIIYQDITNHILSDFSSVIFPALHFALFTYPKEIYLVGCDTSNTGHFYQEKKSELQFLHSTLEMILPNVKVGYARFKMFARLYYPDTEIISINPVGLKGLFKDIYTEEYKKSLNVEE